MPEQMAGDRGCKSWEVEDRGEALTFSGHMGRGTGTDHLPEGSVRKSCKGEGHRGNGKMLVLPEQMFEEEG